MKVWMWQRLYKINGEAEVHSEYGMWRYSYSFFSVPDEYWHWLCPKPNLVLVDRKHLGGME